MAIVHTNVVNGNNWGGWGSSSNGSSNCSSITRIGRYDVGWEFTMESSGLGVELADTLFVLEIEM